MDRQAKLSAVAQACRVYGIDFSLAGGLQGVIERNEHTNEIAMDAQPELITVSNSGIPAFLTNYVDPKLIEVLVTKNKAAQILGENKKGDWITPTALFPVVERAGEVSSYGDYAGNGEVTANVNWPQRQSYHYQTVSQWGERQLAQMGAGQIDWASQINISSAVIMDKFQNKTYFYGVSGLQCYGLLNDPSLPTPIAPAAKAGGGFVWTGATALEIYEDIKRLFTQLVVQSNGVLDTDASMKLCLSNTRSTELLKLTPFNVSVKTMLSQNFPNMTIETAPEYTTGSGELMQLIADSVEGQDVGYAAFTEKMRAHAIVRDMSSFKQKKSGGTWGAIILQPFAIAQELGI